MNNSSLRSVNSGDNGADAIAIAIRGEKTGRDIVDAKIACLSCAPRAIHRQPRRPDPGLARHLESHGFGTRTGDCGRSRDAAGIGDAYRARRAARNCQCPRGQYRLDHARGIPHGRGDSAKLGSGQLRRIGGKSIGAKREAARFARAEIQSPNDLLFRRHFHNAIRIGKAENRVPVSKALGTSGGLRDEVRPGRGAECPHRINRAETPVLLQPVAAAQVHRRHEFIGGGISAPDAIVEHQDIPRAGQIGGNPLRVVLVEQLLVSGRSSAIRPGISPPIENVAAAAIPPALAGGSFLSGG